MKLQLTGQFADKQTCAESSHRLANSQANQLADSKYLKITKGYFIFGLVILSVWDRRTYAAKNRYCPTSVYNRP